ncbi:MAG: diguanylate cyclase, partial [Lachnospiraceae bacterium]|nr:diguanylate cyclase [Lachnospiraceae bacterium]
MTSVERSAQADFMEMNKRVMGNLGGYEEGSGQKGEDGQSRTEFLWDSLMEVSDVKYFWKDKDRRFIGASKSFLDFYGLELADIIGRNDEEMGWHPDDVPYRTDEFNVIEKGVIIRNSPGQIYAKGAKVDILATKYPLYRNGEIVGLLGYFLDTDTVLSDEAEMEHALFMDTRTGVLNSRGLLLIMQGLDDNYRRNGAAYSVSMFEVSEYQKVHFRISRESAEELSTEVGRRISEVFGSDALIAKTGNCSFTVCVKDKSEDEVNDLNEKCIDSMMKVWPEEGSDTKIELTVSCGTAYSEEAASVQEMLTIMLKRFNESKKYNGIEDEYRAEDSAEVPDIDRDVPLPMMILRPIYSDKGVKDVRYIYVNDRYCQYTGLSRNDLLGKGYLELFGGGDEPWIGYAGRAANGETVNGRAFINALGQWMEFVGMPSSIPGCCTVMFWPVDDSKNERDFLTKGHAADNAIIRIAGYLNDTEEYEKAVRESLKELGRVTYCDRVYILDMEGMPLFEWCASGLISRSEIGEDAPEIILDRLRADFIKDGCCIIDDPEKIRRKNPETYDFIKRQG